MTDSIAQNRVRRLVRMIERYRTALNEAEVSDEVSQDLQRLCRYLSHLSAAEATNMLKSTKNARQKSLDFAPRLADLELNEVFEILEKEHSARKELEALAAARFGVPKGSLSSFSNISMLKEKIATLARNEQAHKTISEVGRHVRS